MASLAWIDDTLARLRSRQLERSLRQFPGVGGAFEVAGRECISFSSNDYLGFSERPELLQAVRGAQQAGSAASRLVGGSLPVHTLCESALSRHFRSEGALSFGAGYLANIGLLSAAFTRNDTIVSDKLAHASIIDGIRLSRAKHLRFNHNDVNHLERLLSAAAKRRQAAARLCVITESVFSMDGDLAPLAEIQQLCRAYDAEMVVDEAHAVGVFGAEGRGRAVDLGPELLARTMTMSKSLGSFGGAVLCGEPLKQFLINTARSFIYSTALPPASAHASTAAIGLLRDNPGLGSIVLERAAAFRETLSSAGLNTGNSESQIVPIVLGENSTALRMASLLESDGIFCTAIREPSVPRGTARLRFSVCAVHTPEALNWAASRIVDRYKEAVCAV